MSGSQKIRSGDIRMITGEQKNSVGPSISIAVGNKSSIARDINIESRKSNTYFKASGGGILKVVDTEIFLKSSPRGNLSVQTAQTEDIRSSGAIVVESGNSMASESGSASIQGSEINLLGGANTGLETNSSSIVFQSGSGKISGNITLNSGISIH